MSVHARYNNISTSDTQMHSIELRGLNDSLLCEYILVFENFNCIDRLTIKLPTPRISRKNAIPLLFHCIREIISNREGFLQTDINAEFRTRRTNEGVLVISGCGYDTCASVKETDDEIVIDIAHDFLTEVLVLRLIEIECTMFKESKIVTKHSTLYKEALIEFLVDRSFNYDSAYYRPKLMLTNGFEGLNSLSVSQLEEDVKLWFRNSGMETVRMLFEEKVRQCERS